MGIKIRLAFWGLFMSKYLLCPVASILMSEVEMAVDHQALVGRGNVEQCGWFSRFNS